MITDFCYLAACAMHGAAPDAQQVASMDMEALWKMAHAHKMTAMIAMALEQVSAHPEEVVKNWDQWKHAKDFAICRRMLFDADPAYFSAWYLAATEAFGGMDSYICNGLGITGRQKEEFQRLYLRTAES